MTILFIYKFIYLYIYISIIYIYIYGSIHRCNLSFLGSGSTSQDFFYMDLEMHGLA